MVDRKARNLLLLSRSGAQTGAALELLEEMKSKGVKIVAPVCDISDERALLSVLETCSRTMPLIKGCIQGSMVLRVCPSSSLVSRSADLFQDGLFETMSLENFKAALTPKVRGSWNLHIHLPENMDFFILLSSTAGVIGSAGQSNYAAGNTYQDLLARHRVSLGRKCFALDLGLVLSVGYAAEISGMTDSLKKKGHSGIREIELHAMLDYLCDPSLKVPSPFDTQIVTGLDKILTMGKEAVDQPYWMRKPLFRNLVLIGGDTQGSEPSVNYETLLRSVTGSQAEVGNVIGRSLIQKLARLLSIPEADIDSAKPVYSYGVDSLVAVEIRYWLMKELKTDVSIFRIMSNDSLDLLSFWIAGQSDFFGKKKSK